ncbi:MAG TPA: hypothetical protein VIO16_13690 [Dehalococcoidia bacterium]
MAHADDAFNFNLAERHCSLDPGRSATCSDTQLPEIDVHRRTTRMGGQRGLRLLLDPCDRLRCGINVTEIVQAGPLPPITVRAAAPWQYSIAGVAGDQSRAIVFRVESNRWVRVAGSDRSCH